MSRPAPARAWYELVNETIAVKGWSVAELSERSGVARSTIYGWRDNPRKPQAKSVNAVADMIGIDRARAVRLAGIVLSEPAADEERVRPISAHLRREITEELSPEDAARVIGLLEGTLVVSEPGEERGEDAAHPRAG
jgi:transcriptional regulator with XRE-family HTH domain